MVSAFMNELINVRLTKLSLTSPHSLPTVILEYTAVGGLINGLSNAYFGAWGSFFNSVFCFGTWLKENKNIDFFVRESNEEEADESAES